MFGHELAWREKRLMFTAGDTLADAVEEFNLRNRVQLRLDPRAALLPVRGGFDASDPVTFAAAHGQDLARRRAATCSRYAADQRRVTLR